MRCRKCQGQVEPIIKAGKFCFNFCRLCKISYNEHGVSEMNSGQLSSRFNPLATARDIIGKTNAGATPVARTALEVFLMDGLWNCYLQGLKDGVLLAYSQDVRPGEPLTTEGEPDGSLPDSSKSTEQDQ